MLPGRMVEAVCQSLRFQRSGTAGDCLGHARIHGETSGDGPPAWSERCYSEVTHTLLAGCSSTAGASWPRSSSLVRKHHPYGAPMPCAADSSISRGGNISRNSVDLEKLCVRRPQEVSLLTLALHASFSWPNPSPGGRLDRSAGFLALAEGVGEIPR